MKVILGILLTVLCAAVLGECADAREQRSLVALVRVADSLATEVEICKYQTNRLGKRLGVLETTVKRRRR